MGRCIEWKLRYADLWVSTVWQLADFEPEADAEAVIRLLGLVL